MAKQVFSELSEAEWAWVQQQLDATPHFIERFSPEDGSQPVTLAALDRAWAAWLRQAPQDSDELNATINIVGIRFGQFLVDEAGYRWVIASDSHGTDLAVLALPGRNDVLTYPANFVAKRWERREAGFLQSSFQGMKREVDQIAANGRASDGRPWWKRW